MLAMLCRYLALGSGVSKAVYIRKPKKNYIYKKKKIKSDTISLNVLLITCYCQSVALSL